MKPKYFFSILIPAYLCLISTSYAQVILEHSAASNHFAGSNTGNVTMDVSGSANMLVAFVQTNGSVSSVSYDDGSTSSGLNAFAAASTSNGGYTNSVWTLANPTASTGGTVSDDLSPESWKCGSQYVEISLVNGTHHAEAKPGGGTFPEQQYLRLRARRTAE